MVYEFNFPDVGEGIAKGVVVEWLVKVGDKVKADQDIVKVETDKAVVDLPSPAAGKIKSINAKKGATIKVGQSLASIDDGSKTTTQSASTKKTGAVVGDLSSNVRNISFNRSSSSVSSPTVSSSSPGTPTQPAWLNNNQQPQPTQQSSAPESSKPSTALKIKKKYDQFGYIDRIPLSGIRASIAHNMTLSNQVPQVTIMEEIDVTKLAELRLSQKPALLKKKIKLSYLPYIIQASIRAMKKVPLMNASLVEEEIIIKKYYNVGIAIDSERGLLVPVIKIAENKSVEVLAKEIQDLAVKVRAGKADVMDLKGGSFTITNWGSVAGLFGTPLLKPGESSIIGLGRIKDKLIPDGSSTKVIKSLPISITFDHRILDGAKASLFLSHLKSFLENPSSLSKPLPKTNTNVENKPKSSKAPIPKTKKLITKKKSTVKKKLARKRKVASKVATKKKKRRGLIHNVKQFLLS